MMRIDVEKIQQLIEQIREFNRIPIGDLEFYEKGERLNIPSEIIYEFKFTGLANSDFIDIRYWEEEFVESLNEVIPFWDTPFHLSNFSETTSLKTTREIKITVGGGEGGGKISKDAIGIGA